MVPAAQVKLPEGKKGLIVGIANDQSIAWGCAKAFRAFERSPMNHSSPHSDTRPTLDHESTLVRDRSE
jgi:hypothetical protein